MFIEDRASVDHAAELITRFGDAAGMQAAARAEESRDRGNVQHFCRWRQIERLILVLLEDEPSGTCH